MNRVWDTLKSWFQRSESAANIAQKPPERRVVNWVMYSEQGDYADLECGHRVPLRVYRIGVLPCWECLNPIPAQSNTTYPGSPLDPIQKEPTS